MLWPEKRSHDWLQSSSLNPLLLPFIYFSPAIIRSFQTKFRGHILPSLKTGVNTHTYTQTHTQCKQFSTKTEREKQISVLKKINSTFVMAHRLNFSFSTTLTAQFCSNQMNHFILILEQFLIQSFHSALTVFSLYKQVCVFYKQQVCMWDSAVYWQLRCSTHSV